MQIREYLKRHGTDKIHILAINLQENRFGAAPARLRRMVSGLHPAIRVVAGGEKVLRDFDRVSNVPAVFVFGKDGREAFRMGVTRPPGGKDHIRREQIAKIVSELN